MNAIPPRGPKLYVKTIIGDKVFIRRPGEPPSLAYVEAMGVTVPPEWMPEYESLRARRVAAEQDRGTLAGWWADWEKFEAILGGLGCSAEYQAQLLPDGQLGNLEEL